MGVSSSTLVGRSLGEAVRRFRRRRQRRKNARARSARMATGTPTAGPIMVPKLFEFEELAAGLEEDVAAAAVGDVDVIKVVAPPFSVTTDVRIEKDGLDEPWVAAFLPEALGEVGEAVEGDADDDEGVLEAGTELKAGAELEAGALAVDEGALPMLPMLVPPPAMIGSAANENLLVLVSQQPGLGRFVSQQ